ncbi:unnamed protein product, partial [Polarella glacialis]
MLEVGLVPHVETYTALISAHAKAGNKQEVGNMLQEMGAKGVAPTGDTWGWAIIASSAISSSRRSGSKVPTPRPGVKALGPEEVFRKMLQTGVEPTSFTISALDQTLGQTARLRLWHDLGLTKAELLEAEEAEQSEAEALALSVENEQGSSEQENDEQTRSRTPKWVKKKKVWTEAPGPYANGGPDTGDFTFQDSNK